MFYRFVEDVVAVVHTVCLEVNYEIIFCNSCPSPVTVFCTFAVTCFVRSKSDIELHACFFFKESSSFVTKAELVESTNMLVACIPVTCYCLPCDCITYIRFCIVETCNEINKWCIESKSKVTEEWVCTWSRNWTEVRSILVICCLRHVSNWICYETRNKLFKSFFWINKVVTISVLTVDIVQLFCLITSVVFHFCFCQCNFYVYRAVWKEASYELVVWFHTYCYRIKVKTFFLTKRFCDCCRTNFCCFCWTFHCDCSRTCICWKFCWNCLFAACKVVTLYTDHCPWYEVNLCLFSVAVISSTN